MAVSMASSFRFVTRLFVGFALLRRTLTRFQFLVWFTRLVFLCPSFSWRSPVFFLGSSSQLQLIQLQFIAVTLVQSQIEMSGGLWTRKLPRLMVLCGLRLTRLTCLTCCKGICRVCGVLVFSVFGVCGFLVCLLGGFLVCFWFCFLFPFASCTP